MPYHHIVGLLLVGVFQFLPGLEPLTDVRIDGVTQYAVDEVRAAVARDRALRRGIEQRQAPAVLEQLSAAAIQRGYRRAGYTQATAMRSGPGHLVVREGRRRRLRNVELSGALLERQELLDVLTHGEKGTPRAALGEWIRADEQWLQDTGRRVITAHEDAGFLDARVVVRIEDIDDEQADLVVLCRVPEGRRLHGIRIEGAERNDSQQVVAWLRDAADIQDEMLAGGHLLRTVRRLLHESGRFLECSASFERRQPFDAVDLVVRVVESPYMPLLGEPDPRGVAAVRRLVDWMHDGFMSEQQTLRTRVIINDQERADVQLDYLNQIMARVGLPGQSLQHGLLLGGDTIALWDSLTDVWHHVLADSVAWHKTIEVRLETSQPTHPGDVGLTTGFNAGMSTKDRQRPLLQVTMSPSFAVLLLSQPGAQVDDYDDGSLRVFSEHSGLWLHIEDSGRLVGAGGSGSDEDGNEVRLIIDCIATSPRVFEPAQNQITARLLASSVTAIATEVGYSPDEERLVDLMHGGIELVEMVMRALGRWQQGGSDDEDGFEIPCIISSQMRMSDIIPMLGMMAEEIGDELWEHGSWPRTLTYGTSAVLGGRYVEAGAAIQRLLAAPDFGPLGATAMVFLSDRLGQRQLADLFEGRARARYDEASFIVDFEAISGRHRLLDRLVTAIDPEILRLLLPADQQALLQSIGDASPDWRPMAAWLWRVVLAEGLDALLQGRKAGSE